MHRLTLARALALAVVLLAVACSDDGETTSANGSAPATTDRVCAAFAGPGPPVVGTVPVAGEVRTYEVAVPASYDGTEPAALILNWHGSGSSAEQQAAYSGLADVADALVVTPQGTGEPRHFSLIPGPSNPDLGFARAIVEQMGNQYCVDPDRVFSTGISNGSGLTAELACQAPDVFAAVALVAATVGPLACEASTRMPVLAFHGTSDRVVPYEGGPLGGTGLLLPSAEQGIRRWAAQDRCRPEPVVERIEPDVVHWTFEGCEADVEAYWIEGGGHVWPGAEERAHLGRTTSTIDASELIASWFAEHGRR